MPDPPGTLRRIDDPQAEVERLARERTRRKVALADCILDGRKASNGDDEVLWLSLWTDGHPDWDLPADFITRLAAAAREILGAARD